MVGTSACLTDEVLLDLINQIPCEPASSQPSTQPPRAETGPSPGEKVKYRCGVCRKFGHTRSNCDSTLVALYRRAPYEPHGLARRKNAKAATTIKTTTAAKKA
ncbi:uncharacterized protein [Coffea arabica]|uniref:Uncharacterized protein n=1 Tax=Coffea arabica TaxID=13443 RepID=A0ABM4UWP6_COFAR